ncbi:hypothetical protein D3C76_1444800 [compost metagenome]
MLNLEKQVLADRAGIGHRQQRLGSLEEGLDDNGGLIGPPLVDGGFADATVTDLKLCSVSSW